MSTVPARMYEGKYQLFIGGSWTNVEDLRGQYGYAADPSDIRATMGDHEEMVEKLCKNPAEIVNEMTLTKAHLLHMVLGVAGEVGELVDAIKKHCFYDKPLDYVNLAEELGDLEFYLAGLRQGLQLKREGILQGNIDKLSVRYKNFEYSNERAIARADKKCPHGYIQDACILCVHV